jgi:uncharacterized protein (DUF342 family)
LPRGKNIIISEDKKEIIAKSSGYISFVNNKINISPILEIHGDVGNSTGDIVFNGAVNISGNVLNGFSVTADGDITVNGVVEGAAISSGSHVFLKNGVQGMDKAVIKSGGDIIAKYIEHSEVVAGNNIAAESIMHSKVTCYGQLGLYGKNASLIGGATSVKSYVKAKYIGSPMSTVTEIRVGNDPLMVSEYERLSRQMNDYRQALLKEEERLEKLNRLLESAPNNEKVQNSIDSAMSSKTYVEEQVLDTENELRSVIGKLSGKKGFVVAENKVYPGVKIIIGNSMLIIKEEMERVTLYNSENGIKISNLP